MRLLALSFLVVCGTLNATDWYLQSTGTSMPQDSVEVKGAYLLGRDSSGNLVPQAMTPGGGVSLSGNTVTATLSGNVTVNGMASLSTSAAASATQATLAVVAGHVTSTALGTVASPSNVSITGNVTVGGFVQLTSAAYAVVNNVVTTINLTSTAGYNGGKPVVAVLSGNGAFRWAQANSVTAPYYLTGTAGHYQAGSTTAIAVIEQATGGTNSPHLFVVGAGSNCDVWVGIQRKE